MYELFLNAVIKDGDFEMACAVLQGLTWMSARHNIYHISFYAGLPQPSGLPALRSMQQSRLPQLPLWSELNKEFKRSSYIFQLAHEVFLDKDFGNGNVVDFNSMPGTLRWTEFPDPPREKGQLVMQRKKIDIPEQKNLLSVMIGNTQEYKAELIQETFTFVRGNVEFALSRHYYVTQGSTKQSAPTASLPAWSEIIPVDPARKWALKVSLNVMEDSQPEKMKKANEELMGVKTELDQMFEFQAIDRRIFDTRIPKPPKLPGRGP